MRQTSAPVSFLNRLRRNTRGNVGILFGLTAVPLILAVGAGVDLTRAVEFKSTLQNAVDTAAVAGASAYTSDETADVAAQTATNYMNAAIARLPANSGITFTVTPSTLSSGGSTSGYIVKVAASGTASNSIMAMVKKSMGVSVGATAENPIVSIQFGGTGPQGSLPSRPFTSSAYDLNQIYYYLVPLDGVAPPVSQMTLLYSNAPDGPKEAAPITLASTQKIGFALVNQTGYQNPPSTDYGCNQYNGCYGSEHDFYSTLQPPSQDAYPSVAQNCSLQVLPYTPPSTTTQTSRNTRGGIGSWLLASVISPAYAGSDNSSSTGSTTLPAANLPQAQAGSCLPATPSAQTVQYLTPSCASAGGKSLEFAWNDMGGTTDDKDFNDAVYTFSCSGVNVSGGGGNGGGNGSGSVSGATNVMLIK